MIKRVCNENYLWVMFTEVYAAKADNVALLTQP